MQAELEKNNKNKKERKGERNRRDRIAFLSYLMKCQKHRMSKSEKGEEKKKMKDLIRRGRSHHPFFLLLETHNIQSESRKKIRKKERKGYKEIVLIVLLFNILLQLPNIRGEF